MCWPLTSLVRLSANKLFALFRIVGHRDERAKGILFHIVELFDIFSVTFGKKTVEILSKTNFCFNAVLLVRYLKLGPNF